MPGILHQGILDLFCDDPWLPFDILGLERPGSGPLIDRRTDVEYVVVHPKTHKKGIKMGLPDLVLSSRDPKDTGPGIVICIEAQGRRDDEKRYSIPFYQGVLAHHHQLSTWVAIVSFSAAFSSDLRAWSKGPPPRVDVLILDADTVPVPVSMDAACARPTAAVLAATLHGRRGDLDAARLGLNAIRGLPRRTRLRYTQTILAALSNARRELLEAELPVEEQNKLWHIERESSPYVYGVKEGREQGRRETLVELILALLEVRGLSIDDASEARVRGCEQLGTLRNWAQQAREVAVVTELFAQQ